MWQWAILLSKLWILIITHLSQHCDSLILVKRCEAVTAGQNEYLQETNREGLHGQPAH